MKASILNRKMGVNGISTMEKNVLFHRTGKRRAWHATLSSCLFLLLQCTLRVALSIVGKQDAFAFVEGFDVDGAAPQHIDMLEGFLTVDEIEFLALEEMFDI